MDKSIPNPDYVDAPIEMTAMTVHGCYHRHGDEWWQYMGPTDMGDFEWIKVDASEVPEMLKHLYG